jgi:hypothetical protein
MGDRSTAFLSLLLWATNTSKLVIATKIRIGFLLKQSMPRVEKRMLMQSARE